LEQPFNFASQLNQTRERIYSTAAINAEAQGLPLEDNAEALSLTLTLAKEAALREPD
jgi:hypothetical protein